MEMISFVSVKGGAGKTTALMAACSSLANRGHKVGLFEADLNTPLRVWKTNAERLGTWSDACKISPAEDIATFERSYGAAETVGIDYALIDTAGGASDLTDLVLVNSNIVLVPTSLTTLDMIATIDTMTHAVELFMKSSVDIPIAIVLQRIPVGKMTTAMASDLAQIEEMPCLKSRFHARDAFAALQSRGLLHKYHQLLDADPHRKLMARHLLVAIEESDQFVDEILSEISEDRG